MEKDYLVLKRASASRTSGQWKEVDFDVNSPAGLWRSIFCDAISMLSLLRAAVLPRIEFALDIFRLGSSGNANAAT